MRRTVILAASAFACVLAGAAVFSATDHVGFWRGLYCSVGTAATVGCDTTPAGTSGRIAAVAVELTAIPLLGATFASLTAMHVHRRIGRRLDQHLDDVRAHIDRALTRTEHPQATEERADDR